MAYQVSSPATVIAALAALHGATAITAGAFGAHGADDARAAELLRTGALWQSIAAVTALFCAWRGAFLAGGLFIIGALFFAGSLYGLAMGAPTALAFAAPVGGGAMILAWLALAWRELKDLRR